MQPVINNTNVWYRLILFSFDANVAFILKLLKDSAFDLPA